MSMKGLLKNNSILLLFFISSVGVLLVSFYSQSTISRATETIGITSQEKMVALSQAAALLTTADELDNYMVEDDMKKEGYAALSKKLIDFTKENDISYTYFLRLDKSTNKMQFIADNFEPVSVALSADPVGREPTPDKALEGHATAVDIGSYSEDWEGYVTAFAPVYYSDGRLSDIVAGVDMQDVYILETGRDVRVLSYMVMVMMVLIIGTGFVCLMMYRKKVSQADAANVSKSSFLSTMSHEMRTPMNAIIGMTKIARDSEGDAERTEYCLDKIGNAAQHLLGVINDVLDISKIEAGKFTLSENCFNFRETVKKVDDVIRFISEEKKQELIIDIDRKVPIFVKADSQRLAQIMTNLLSNAVKFTPESGRVSLKIFVAGHRNDKYRIQVEVEDNGIGISPEQQKNLFKSFQQADNSVARRFGGTGLGLSISKSIAELMGGTMWIESAQGKGSTFFFTANVEYAESSDSSSEQAESDGNDVSEFSGKRILLAEDVDINREILTSLLEETGITIDCAENGLKAYEMFSVNPEKYDLIFMDIHMPVMDGYSATKKIRDLCNSSAVTIPIVAMTANVFREDIEKCLAVGMNDHIGKPINLEDVLDMLRKYLL